MEHLTKKQINDLEQRMRARQRQLIDEVRERRDQAASDAEAEPTGAVGDAGDESVARMITDLGIQETGRDIEELRDIDAALARMEDGSYGICETCGGEIDQRRLEAQPIASRCITCQSQYEKTYAHKGTPTL
jgi:DnaK suppressor protein